VVPDWYRYGDSILKKLIRSWQIFIQCRGKESSRAELFNQLWSCYQRPITFFIRNMVKDNVEDLFQEVMLKVYRNLDKYNPVYSFNTWIYSIARHHCLNHIRKRKLPAVNFDKEGTNDFETKNISSPETQALNKELHQIITSILNRFDEDNRQIAFLRFFEGMKNSDIARVMDIPAGTVKSRLHKIRTALKIDLEKYHGQ